MINRKQTIKQDRNELLHAGIIYHFLHISSEYSKGLLLVKVKHVEIERRKYLLCYRYFVRCICIHVTCLSLSLKCVGKRSNNSRP